MIAQRLTGIWAGNEWQVRIITSDNGIIGEGDRCWTHSEGVFLKQQTSSIISSNKVAPTTDDKTSVATEFYLSCAFHCVSKNIHPLFLHHQIACVAVPSPVSQKLSLNKLPFNLCVRIQMGWQWMTQTSLRVSSFELLLLLPFLTTSLDVSSN